jgi:hypothetical protein
MALSCSLASRKGVCPLAPEGIDDPARARDGVQALTLFALRRLGVVDARARGLVVQAALPEVRGT